MRFASFAPLVLFIVVQTNAVTTWSGDACDSKDAEDFPCNGTCFSFVGRHSFIAGSPGDPECVAFYVDEDCNGESFAFKDQEGECTNVNTGTAINSFRCFPGAEC
ncbi:hypothetical protein AURDEDRAFT_173141 [Auricularia subglabra TFB-10046 SS5]|nr:hypothetical protein AURDEDRAFT_173141 [Auricularia subglabra TFB-10046 SS5]